MLVNEDLVQVNLKCIYKYIYKHIVFFLAKY